MREYQRLETGEGVGECYSSQPECYTARPLQGLHLAAFITSLLFCFAVVVSFLWFLPCEFATCSVVRENTPNIPWDKTYTGVELYGGLHIVGSHLVLLERAPLWGYSSIRPDDGRLLALSLATGEVSWYSRLPSNESSLICPPDQPPLCFTLSKPNTLFAINPITGVIAWRFSNKLEEALDFLVAVPDSNKDGYSDLALIAWKKTGKVNVLIVSGGDGRILTTEDTNCTSAANLTFEKSNAHLRYDCILSSTERVSRLVPVPGVISGKLKSRPPATRPRAVSPYGLTIQYRNVGICPRDCSTNISISSPDRVSLVWHYNENGSFLMTPIPIKFKPNLTGFLLKLWHWKLPSTEIKGVTVESITERIMLLTFDNKMKARVVNASQTQITRLCNSTEPWQCQPSIHSNTALIADVNGDHFQDLVSYYVTYRPEDTSVTSKASTSWLLESKIRMIRLEAELPKLNDHINT